MSPSLPTASEGRAQLPVSRKIIWGLGGFADFLMLKGAGTLISPIYTVALGYNPLLVTAVQAFVRLLDVVTDPVIGHLSDNTRSRWGRRRPWMFVGALLSAVFVALLFLPPHVPMVSPDTGVWDAFGVQWRGILYFLVIMTGLYAIGYSMYIIPYTGMGLEMTESSHERTDLFKWRSLAYSVAGFMTPWLPYFAMRLEGPDWVIHKGAQGAQYLGIGLGLAIIAIGVLPAFLCREHLRSSVEVPKVKFRVALRSALRCRALWPLVAANFVTKFGMISTGIFFYYVFVYHVAGGNQRDGTAFLGVYFNFINIANVAVGIILIAWLTKFLGKKPTLLLCLALSALGYGTFGFTSSNAEWAFTTISLGSALSFTMQWPSLFTGAMIGLFTNSMPMILNSMLGDVCDLDELETGRRNDAFFSAVFVSSDKLAMSLATIFQGALLVWSGFDAARAIQAPDTIQLWLTMLVVTQPLGFIGGFVCVCFYPLSHRRWQEVRRLLDARRVTGDAARAQQPDHVN